MLKLSIILPTFNNGQSLEPCLQSIIGQSYRNFELIVIDGKSTDNTLEIIRKYEASIFYWNSEKDNSSSEAVNKAFNHATGDIITILGADDYYVDNTVFEQISKEFITNPKIDLLFYNINQMDLKTGEFISVYKNKKELFFSLNKHDKSIFKHIKKGCLSGLVFAGMAVKRKSMLNVKFDDCNIVADYDYILNMWRKGCFFHMIDSPLINVKLGGVSHTAKTWLQVKDRFLINKKYFGLFMAIRKNPLMLYFEPIERFLRNHGFRPFSWGRKIKSFLGLKQEHLLK